MSETRATYSVNRRKTKPRSLWLVRCAGNPLVEYEVLGDLKPTACPACGGKATVQIKGAPEPTRSDQQ